nr:non-ribosomal peptide synthetase [Glycomyces sp. L485]
MRNDSPEPAAPPRRLLAEQLGVEPHDLPDDRPLAALGVDSLTALRWRSALARDTGVTVPLVAMTGDRTLREVAAAWSEQGADATPAASGADPAPPSPVLTEVQQAYWAGRGRDFPLGGVATFWYNEYDREPDRFAGRTAEEDVDRLERAWRRVLARHPMLRTVIGRDAVPKVATYDVRDFRVGRVDLRDDPAWRERLDELRHELSHQLRPTDTWPLCDVTAVLLPEGRVRWCVGLDALLVDFASWGLIMTEWGAIDREPHRQLDEPPATFAELLAERAADPDRRLARARDRDWWRARDLPPAPGLPLHSPPERGARFRRLRHVVPAQTWQAVQAHAATAGVSPTTVVLTAFALLCQRRSQGQRDLTVNLTVYDRPEVPGIERVVGDFSGTALLALRTNDGIDAAGPAPFADQARAVGRNFWEALDHRAYSGVEVARDRGDGAAWPIVFTSGLGQSSAEADRWLGDRVFGVSQTPQVLLDHLVWEEDGDLVLVHDMVEGAYAEGVVEGLAEAERALLAGLAEADRWHEPGPVWDPSGLAAEPTPRDTEAGPLLHDLWRHHLAEPARGDTPAVITAESAIGHRELRHRANRLAARLREAGVRTGDLVMIALPKSAAQAVAALAVETAGAGYVPVDPAWPTRRLEAAARKTGLTFAVTQAGTAPDLPDGVRGVGVDLLGRGPEGPRTEPAAAWDARDDDLAYVIFTSGSTGEPKGVAIEHRQARATIDDVNDRFAIGAADRVLAVSALSFDLSVHDLFGTMGAGGAIVVPDAARARDPQHWLDLMGRHRVTVWNSAPPLLEMLVEYAEADPGAAARALAALRVCLLSGDWIPVTLPDRLRALAPHAEVHSLGGATEAAIWSITHPIGEVDPRWASIPYGRPLRGQSFLVLDEALAPVPAGVDGELFIGGDGVAQGYIGDPGITAERFIEHPALGRRLYRTGDLGRWRPDGTLEFLGRVDRQVKIGGHRIELGEVEAALSRLPDVRQALVSAMPGPDGRKRLVAHVARHLGDTAEDEDAFAARLLAELGEEVPEYMKPSRLVVVEALPVSANGKIDPEQLENPFAPKRKEPEPADAEAADPPAAEREDRAEDPARAAILTAIGPDVDLDRAPVAAGLTSLQLVRIANAVEDAGRDRPALTDLLAATSLRALVDQWSAADDPEARPDATPTPAPQPAPQPPTETPSPPRTTVPATPDGLAAELRTLADLLDEVSSRADAIGLPIEIASRTRPAPPPAAPANLAAVAAVEAPMTEMQLAYLVGRAPDRDGRVAAPHYYTEALVEDLDPARLERAWRTVVARHPMLRAVVTDDSTQRVLETTEPDLEVIDARDRAPAEQQRLRERLRRERSHRLLSPRRAPMAAAAAVRLDDRQWRLHLDLDLLFFDAESACVWVGELATEYERPGSLPPAPATDFLAWARALEPSPEALAHARRQAAELPPGPEIGRRTDPAADPAVVRRRRSYSQAQWTTVREQAQRQGVTPSALLLDLLGGVLATESRPSATVVLTVSGRPAGHGGVVGDYTSTVLLDLAGRTGSSAAELQERLMAALEHGTGRGGVHGNEVIRRMRAEHVEVDLPVAVSAALESSSIDASQLLEVIGRTEYAVSQTPQVLVDVQLFCVEDRLEIVLDIDQSRVDAVWADRMFACLTEGMDALVLEPPRRSRPDDAAEAVRRDVAAVFGALIDAEATGDKSWFDLGATSLTLVTAHRELRARGHDVDVVDLFAHPSPAATVAHLIGLRRQPVETPEPIEERAAVRPPEERPAAPPVEPRIPVQASRGARRRAARRTRAQA